VSVTKTEINTTEETQAEEYYYKSEFQAKIIESGNDWLDHQSSVSVYIGYNILGYEQVVLDQTSSKTHNIYDENYELQHATGGSFKSNMSKIRRQKELITLSNTNIFKEISAKPISCLTVDTIYFSMMFTL
jgi:hypothetical protein